MWWEPVVQKWFRRHFMPRPINPASSSPLLFSSRQPAPHNDYSPELQQPLERNRPPSYTSLSLCSVCIFLQTYPFTMMTRLIYINPVLRWSLALLSVQKWKWLILRILSWASKQTVRNYFRFHNIPNIKYWINNFYWTRNDFQNKPIFPWLCHLC